MATSSDKSVICPVLIGRQSIIAGLRRLIEQARSGHGQTALLAGEAGIGKSRLVAETKAFLRAESSALILEGRCFEPDRSLAYAPLLDVLHAHLSTRSAAEIERDYAMVAPEMLKLVPEFSTALSGRVPASPLSPEYEKRRLFQAMAQFFTHLAEAGRKHDRSALLIVVEDLHWSDDTSLEFILYLARRIAAQPILLLLTYRNDEAHTSLNHFLAQLDRERLAAEWVLPPLDRAEVDVMLQTIFGLKHPAYAEFLEPLCALTEGNPFFVEEVLKALVAVGDIFYADGRWARKPLSELHIPRSVRDAVQRRVAQLRPEARRVLTLAAVMGRRFDFALLQALTHLPEDELLRHIQECVSAQLVVEASADQFAFRHALTREAIYATLLARERQRLHRLMGETLERAQGESQGTPVGDLARHFYEGAIWDKALAYALRAADQARAVYAPWEAIYHLSRALEAAQALGAPPPLNVYHTRGQCYETVGEFERARSDYEQALSAAHAARDSRAEWQSLIDLGFLWASRGYAQTGEYFERALALARALDDPVTVAHSLNRLGNWHLNLERPAEAFQCHHEALAIFQALDDKPGLAETLDLLGTTSFLAGDLIKGAAYYAQAVALFRALDDRQGLAASLATLAACGAQYENDVCVVSMSLAECVQAAETALKIAREIGQRSAEALALGVLGVCSGPEGNYAQALAYARASLAIAQEIEHRTWQSFAHCALGELHHDVFALPLAQHHLEQALQVARELGWWYGIRAAAGQLALVAIAQNDLARAESVLASALAPDAPAQTAGQRNCWLARAELALARGDTHTVLQIVERLVTSAPNMTAGTVIPHLWKLRAEALAMLKQFEAAEALLRAAQAAAGAQGARWLLWRLHVSLGHVLQQQARSAEADGAFAAARALIAELAANVPEDLRDNYLQHAHAQIPPARPLSPREAAKKEFGGLTARERAVAALIVEGRSSREIAEVLVLSERTVEGYVGNILAKLGFSSRAQIAAWAVDKGLSRPHTA